MERRHTLAGGIYSYQPVLGYDHWLARMAVACRVSAPAWGRKSGAVGINDGAALVVILKREVEEASS